MILRSLTKHVRDQNWFAVGLDFFIVVFGVFIGLQVQEWSGSRQDRQTEAVYLQSLEKDIEVSISSLKGLKTDMEITQSARRQLILYATDQDAVLEAVELDRAIMQGVFFLDSLNVNLVTFETLKSSGDLAIIGSPDLVSGLQSLSTKIQAAKTSQDDEFQVTYLFSDPLLVENFDMIRVFQQLKFSGPSQLAWLSELQRPALTSDVIRTNYFTNIVLYKLYFTSSRIGIIERILDQLDDLANLIDERQAELGVIQ